MHQGASPVVKSCRSTQAKSPSQGWRDYVQLTKPRITLLCLVMAAGGLALAPGNLKPMVVLFTLVGTGLSVASANALNMYWEREGDRLMARTRNRPLASGRMEAWQALAYGVTLGLGSVITLALGVNLLTAGLGLFALLSYVLVYTPLKRRSSLALIVGAVPGAMPPLMGWTAATGRIDTAGLVLFGILFVWQIPHTIAISIRHREDYDRAGIRTLPSDQGDKLAKLQSLAYSLLLVPISLMFVPLGVAGPMYFLAALALGTWFVWLAAKGFRAEPPEKVKDGWARTFFLASLVYLPALTLALVLDLAIGKLLA
jgi:protoheme IX farnesyltransferase